jgi:hypothetical protein
MTDAQNANSAGIDLQSPTVASRTFSPRGLAAPGCQAASTLLGRHPFPQNKSSTLAVPTRHRHQIFHLAIRLSKPSLRKIPAIQNARKLSKNEFGAVSRLQIVVFLTPIF